MMKRMVRVRGFCVPSQGSDREQMSVRIERGDDSFVGWGFYNILPKLVLCLEKKDGGICCTVGALRWIVATYLLFW